MLIPWLFALATAGALPCTVPDEVGADQAGLYCGRPPAVQEYARRRGMCGHFAGEEPYDAQRRREIDAVLDQF